VGARAAVSFLTPLGGARTPGPADLLWFPAVGAGLGAGLGGLWWAAGRAWPAPVGAAIVVAADLALTGLLHIDGLIDSADGLLPHLDRARRLAVMTEPQVGAFGVAVAVGVLALRVTALATIRPNVLVLAGLWCLSRTAMVAVVRWQPYARPGGLAAAFGGGEGRALTLAAVLGFLAGLVLLAFWWPAGGVLGHLAGLAAGAAGLVVAMAVVVLARRRIGGYTGDVLGAAGVLSETIGLVVAAAKW
jgi:adenosylcobinamide-GDP ribazoletransferase